MQNLKITLLQTDLVWENKNANLANLAAKIEQIKESDLIILPEMFSTGFSMEASKLAETMEGNTVNWLKNQAKKSNSAILGSLIIVENEQYFNRLLVVFPQGNLLFYDKRHLFELANEHLSYGAGTKKLIFEYKNWKIAAFICYDLRFPVWLRNVENYDLAVFVANWPDKRISHWNSLLQARAIENQCVVAAVNRVGTDANGFYHSGFSTIINANGEILEQLVDIETAKTATLSLAELHQFREKLPFLKDKDNFELSH